MFHFTALVTCLAILFYFFTSIQVAKARTAFGIKAPAIIGQSRLRAGVSRADEHAGMDADLPALALAVCHLHQRSHRRRLGLVWIAGRILYMTGYSQAADKRGTGFAIQATAAGVLWLGALGAIVWRLVHA